MKGKVKLIELFKIVYYVEKKIYFVGNRDIQIFVYEKNLNKALLKFKLAIKDYIMKFKDNKKFKYEVNYMKKLLGRIN